MSLSQLSKLLPLPNEELQQVLDYGNSLSKEEAVSHFSNLLGDSPQAIDFISSFNSSRKDPKGASKAAAAASSSQPPAPAPVSEPYQGVPKSQRGPKKKKPQIHTPEARRVQDFAGPASTAYNKKTSDLEYIPKHQRGPTASAPGSNEASRSSTPKPAAGPAAAPPPSQPKEKPSAGYLISDPVTKGKSKSTPGSRSSTPKPGSTKVTISGGTPMAGQSTATADLDAAIRALEISTNPTLDNPKSRKCNCVATRHPLSSAAPNCLSCGKVVCAKEGLGPCTSCGTPLLTPAEVQAMMRELRDERGRERMVADAKSNRRAEVSKKPAPFSQARNTTASTDPTIAEAEAKAREHRDKLLNFQAQNAQRTTVRDEAADFDVGTAMSGTGGSMWASPEERAKELKKQLKLMRELEWNAKPDYEKRQQVLSIDLAGGKVVRRMAAIERPVTPPSEEEDAGASDNHGVLAESDGNKARGGAFGRNPLLGSVVRPTFDAKGKGVEAEGRPQKQRGWRKVQDDLDDNEGIILDGGIYGHAQGDEPECG